MNKTLGFVTRSFVVGALAITMSNARTATEVSASGGALLDTVRPTQLDSADFVSNPLGGQGPVNTPGQKAGCMACGGVILSVGIASIGGLLLVSAFLPEVVAGCAFLCTLAFT